MTKRAAARIPSGDGPRARSAEKGQQGMPRIQSQRTQIMTTTKAIEMTMSAKEAADRLAIRELFDAYAHCADRRDAQGQMAPFTPDTRFLVYMDSRSEQPIQELHGRESLAPVFDNLNTYQATMHFNGQSTVVLDGDRATGESYCIAHHLYEVDGQRTLMKAYIRYLDQFARQSDGSWLFAERRLMVDWTETRPSTPCPATARRPAGAETGLLDRIQCVRPSSVRWAPTCDLPLGGG